MRKLTTPLLVALALCIAPFLHAQCTAANTQTFTSSLLGSNISGSPNGFGNAMLTFNQNGIGTISSSTLGLGSNINSLQLFSGNPASGGQMIQTFTTSNTSFQNGRFTNNIVIDPFSASLIAQNPQSFFFVISTPQFPNGAVSGRLSNASATQFSGALNAANVSGGGAAGSAGSFALSLTPITGSSNFNLSFDILTNGLGNNISGVTLMTAGGAPIVIGGGTATSGRLTGTTQITAAQAQQLICSPSAFTLTVNTPAFTNGAIAGNVGTTNEIFIPAIGTVRGLFGTNFVSDLNVFDNDPTGSNANIFVQFFPTATVNSSAQNVSSMILGGHATASSRDVSSTLFNGQLNGVGALRLLSSSNNVFANARIYNNQIAAGLGTFGQFVPGLTRAQALTEGALVGLVNTPNGGGATNFSARTNVGFFNPSDQTTFVAAELRNTTGDVLDNRIITLGPYMHLQLPMVGGGSALFGDLGEIQTSTVYFVSGSPLFAYASVIDNVSGDASYVAPSSK
jgi:hypothetical protein